MDRDLPLTRSAFPRDDLEQDDQLRRKLDEPLQSASGTALIITIAIAIVAGLVYFAPPTGTNTTTVASRDMIQEPGR